MSALIVTLVASHRADVSPISFWDTSTVCLTTESALHCLTFQSGANNTLETIGGRLANYSRAAPFLFIRFCITYFSIQITLTHPADSRSIMCDRETSSNTLPSFCCMFPF